MPTLIIMSGVEGRAAAVALPFHPDRTHHRRYARSTGTKFKLVGNRFRLWTNELVDCYRAGNEALVRRGYGTCFVFQISRWWSSCGRLTDLLRSKVNCWALRRLSPTSRQSYQGMVDFHWSAANLPEAKRLADSLRGVARHPELVLLRIMSRVHVCCCSA